MNTQEQLDYAKYLDDSHPVQHRPELRPLNEYLSDFDILQSQLAALQGRTRATTAAG